jgi:sucrose-6-phosphate hydrolase SacC (GH32 family)
MRSRLNGSGIPRVVSALERLAPALARALPAGVFAVLLISTWVVNAVAQGPRPVLHSDSEIRPTFSVFHDPDGDVSVKEFTFFRNVIVSPDTFMTADTTIISVRLRELYHLVYQRSGGLHIHERTFGHAWSADLVHWSVDTLAFAADTTWWNRRHVWSPCVFEAAGRTYMFYTGVDDADDQRIGYVSTAVLDTTNTVWDTARTMVWQASDTRWAVPDPPVYSGQTQFRDAFVMPDPEQAGCLLMYYEAHDSLNAKLNRGGLTVGVARSDSGSVDVWHDLGYFPSTYRSVSRIGQLEGPHVFSVNGTGTGWRMMFTNAGSPPGENGHTTIRFLDLAPGESPADTTASHWSAPVILEQYLNGAPTSFGWSGSEELHLPGADLLGGFTAWAPGASGIAFTRVLWNGSNFTLGAPNATSVDEYRSPARGVEFAVAEYRPGSGSIAFTIDSPLELDARLEVFDTQGRRIAVPFADRLSRGQTRVTWPFARRDGGRVASGVYFARLRFAGGHRTLQVTVAR